MKRSLFAGLVLAAVVAVGCTLAPTNAPERGPLGPTGKADNVGSCEASCGQAAADSVSIRPPGVVSSASPGTA